MKDLLRFKTIENKVGVVANKVESFRSRELEKAGARVFNDNKIASASYFGSISDNELFRMCSEHQEVALPTQVELVKGRKAHHNTMKQAQLKKDDMLPLVEKQLQFLQKEAPGFQFKGHMNRNEQTIEYTNDCGADFKTHTCKYSVFYAVRKKGSPNIIDAFVYNEGLRTADDPQYLTWTAEGLRAFDHKTSLTSGKRKVMMLPDRSIMGKLSESCRIDMYHQGAALFSGKMKEKLFSEKFNLYDARNDIEHGVFAPFDFEGVEAASDRTELIKNGVFCGLVSDLRNAKKYKASSTANGFRSFDSAVQIGFPGLQIGFGQRNFREILKDAGEVIVLDLAIGGDLTDLGDFSTPVQLGYLVKNGEVVGRLPECSVSANIRNMFGSQLLEVAANGPYNDCSTPYLLMEMDVQVH